MVEYYYEKQSNKDKELSFTQDINWNFENSIIIREIDKKFRINFGEKAYWA
jgi:hypothetical protein